MNLMNTTDKLHDKMVNAERVLDAAVDAAAPTADIRRKEKSMHKAQSAYFAATGKAEPNHAQRRA